MLESLAFARESSLYDLLVQARGAQPALSPPAAAGASGGGAEAGNSNGNGGGSGGGAGASRPAASEGAAHSDGGTLVASTSGAADSAPRAGSPPPGAATASGDSGEPPQHPRTLHNHSRVSGGAGAGAAPLPGSFGHPSGRIPPGPAGAAEATLRAFFSQVLRLGALRIKELCGRLGLEQAFCQQVYTLLQTALYEHTKLFYGRHLDQIILCCVYSLCKVAGPPLTFKDIIYQYRKQPQYQPDVFRTCVLDQTDPGLRPTQRGDIIQFYNRCFIPPMKQSVFRFAPQQPQQQQPAGVAAGAAAGGAQGTPQRPPAPPGAGGDAAGGPAPPAAGGSSLVSQVAVAAAATASPGPLQRGADHQQPNNPLGPPPLSPFPDVLRTASPRKLPGSNVSVSPLRPDKADALRSPKAKSLYAFMWESCLAYQSPARDLEYINARVAGVASGGGLVAAAAAAAAAEQRAATSGGGAASGGSGGAGAVSGGGRSPVPGTRLGGEKRARSGDDSADMPPPKSKGRVAVAAAAAVQSPRQAGGGAS